MFAALPILVVHLRPEKTMDSLTDVISPSAWAMAGEGLYFAMLILMLLVLAALAVRWHRRLQQAQATSEQLQTIVDLAPVAMVVVDESNRIREWNRQAERTFQWKADEMIGRTVFDLIRTYRDHDSLLVLMDELRAGRRISYTEARNLRKDGSTVLCEWVTAPFVDHNHLRGYLIAMARDITEQRLLERQLEQAAHYDSLTALPNRTLILELLKQSMAIARRQRYQLAVLFLDLDGFKAINDTHGHQAGDQLLGTVAERLQSGIRQGDHVGRLAGDEFLVILQNVVDRDSATLVSEKLRSYLLEPCLVNDGQVVAIEGSFGVSMFPQDGDRLESLIHQADQAMYREKQGKR